jgi:hypothetical protein
MAINDSIFILSAMFLVVRESVHSQRIGVAVISVPGLTNPPWMIDESMKSVNELSTLNISDSYIDVWPLNPVASIISSILRLLLMYKSQPPSTSCICPFYHYKNTNSFAALTSVSDSTADVSAVESVASLGSYPPQSPTSS